MAKNDGENFELGWSPEEASNLDSHAGGNGFKLIPWGDVRVKIIEAIGQESKGKSPHLMLVPTFEIIHAYDKSKSAASVGETIKGYYGTKASPEFMQKRTKALMDACKIVPKGKLTNTMFVGKEFDASIIWEVSDSNKIDPNTGKAKKFVNARLLGERPVGGERPKTINPEGDSSAAIKHLEGRGGGDEGGSDEPAPWEQQAQGGTTSDETTDTESTQSGFLDESDVPAGAHEYRARMKLGIEADDMKEALLKHGYDPEGPIELDNLSDETREAYEAKFVKKAAKSNGLPPLGGGSKAKTGTRSARA